MKSIKKITKMTKNAKIVCLADFFWNIGRTLPHAILTVYLMSKGCSLVDIALLQTVYMIVATLTEFPSGIISDIYSRKTVYLLSIVLLFISYFFIAFSTSKIILILAYGLYGFSVSLKSGTLEAEVVLEYRSMGLDIKQYSVISSYILSISSVIGGLIGSFLYSNIDSYIYAISLILFIAAFVAALFCKFNKNKKNTDKSHNTFIDELKLGLSIVKSSKSMLYMLCLYAIATLFLQPFYQYWQVLYTDIGLDTKYFGIMYTVFNLCNLIGTFIYNKLTISNKSIYVLLILIPFVFGIGTFTEFGVLISLPIAVALFFAFNQYLDVEQKRIAPDSTMSSYFSLVGAIVRLSSSVSLFFMAFCIQNLSVQISYILLFIVFSVLSIIMVNIFQKSIDIK